MKPSRCVFGGTGYWQCPPRLPTDRFFDMEDCTADREGDGCLAS